MIVINFQGFDVLSETSALAWPDQVVPSRKLPDSEAGGDIAGACISWRGDGKLFATVTLTDPGLPSPLAIVIAQLLKSAISMPITSVSLSQSLKCSYIIGTLSADLN